MAHPDLLQGNPQIFRKKYGVHDMPAVKTALGQGIVIMIGIKNFAVMVGIINISQEWSCIGPLYGSVMGI
jgi:hypothetical protein